ncbi:13394_t:CDS:2 [Ambispora gerdemannii]|uniref:13394_t:CDS:1 n=1 Tax=Ambispora gerdemannii TaxID=144530 RepID=A0A9N9AF90_9GLOM|nr:13394_t:CDS:2 [Ambispora gerdemannii]
MPPRTKRISNSTTSASRTPLLDETQRLINSFLLDNNVAGPDRIEDAITLQEFISYFPRKHRTNPKVKLLHKEFCTFRRGLSTKVQENIKIHFDSKRECGNIGQTNEDNENDADDDDAEDPMDLDDEEFRKNVR